MSMEHHAMLCIAASLENATQIPDVYKKQNSDVVHIVTDRLSIDHARNLSKEALVRPVVGQKRVFVLVVQALPAEAQNALLKLFEEPPVHTQFYLVVPQEGMLLPTLRSRLQLLEGVKDVTENTSYVSFLEMSYKDRLSHVADLAKQKDIQAMELLLAGAEMTAEASIEKDTHLAKTVLMVRSYFKTPGASKKMLLEELSLALPQH